MLRKALLITFFSNSGSTIVQLMVSIALARMLSPDEVGAFSMAAVFVSIAHIFRDFGVASYLQREPDLTRAKIRSAIGVLFSTSWLVGGLLFLLSSWLGRWFKHEDIEPVLRVLAAGFFIIPFGAISHALLTREFAAGKQAWVNGAGTSTYAVTCLGLAYAGFGTMSMAWANLANIVVTALAYGIVRPRGIPWLPSFRHWGGILNFGFGALVTTTLNTLNSALPDILLGKLASASHVGLFSRANSTVGIFNYVAGATVSYGSVSYISQAHHRGEPLSPLLGRATTLLTGIGWPALALTALLGPEIVSLLYGEKWLDGAPAIPALSLAAALGMLFHYVPAALVAVGRPYLSAIPSGIQVLTRVGLALAFFEGALTQFAWIICLATLMAAPSIMWQQVRYLNWPLRDGLRAVWPSAVVALICLLTGAALRALLPPSLGPLLRLLAVGVPAALVWYAALRWMAHPLEKEVQLLLFRPLRALLARLGLGRRTTPASLTEPVSTVSAGPVSATEVLLYRLTSAQPDAGHLRRYRDAAARAGMDFFVVGLRPANEGAELLLPDGVPRLMFTPQEADGLGYPGQTVGLTGGWTRQAIGLRADLPVLLFWRQRPQYQRYWVVGEEADYAGDPLRLIESLRGRSADLLVTALGQVDSGWAPLETGGLGRGEVLLDQVQRWECAMPFFAVLPQALACIDHAYRLGWSGYYEQAWPSILLSQGLRVVDMGVSSHDADTISPGGPWPAPASVQHQADSEKSKRRWD